MSTYAASENSEQAVPEDQNVEEPELLDGVPRLRLIHHDDEEDEPEGKDRPVNPTAKERRRDYSLAGSAAPKYREAEDRGHKAGKGTSSVRGKVMKSRTTEDIPICGMVLVPGAGELGRDGPEKATSRPLRYGRITDYFPAFKDFSTTTPKKEDKATSTSGAFDPDCSVDGVVREVKVRSRSFPVSRGMGRDASVEQMVSYMTEYLPVPEAVAEERLKKLSFLQRNLITMIQANRTGDTTDMETLLKAMRQAIQDEAQRIRITEKAIESDKKLRQV